MSRSSLFFALLPLAAFACSSTTTPDGAPSGTDAGADGATGAVSAKPDFDAMLRGGDCPAATGEPIEHGGDIVADEVWKAGVHRVTSNVRVLATVTIEACAKVEVGDSRTFQVGGAPKPGKLVLRGSREGGKLLPVRFTSQDEARPWGALVVDSTGVLDATLAVLAGGDSVTAQQNGGGMLRVFGTSSTSEGGVPVVTKNLRSDWLLVEGAKASGVALLRYAGFTDDSTGIAIRGSAGESLRTEIGAAAALPTELVLTVNAKNEVLLEQAWSGTLSTTLRAKNVPYRLDGALYLAPVEDGAPAVLTVEAGVTLRFGTAKGSSGIYVGTSDTRQGQIVAQGTTAAPIRFTSAKDTPAAGDWMGLYFRHYPASGNAIENAVIEYAGGESAATGFGCGPRDNDATILLLGARPSRAFVQGTTLRSGGGNAGIVLGWKSDEGGPDFLSGNRFEAMPACSVSRPRSADNACPGAGEPVCP